MTRSTETADINVRDFAIGRTMDPEVMARLGREGILNHVERTGDGTLLRSVAVALIEAPMEKVVEAVERIRTDDGGFLKNVNIIDGFKVLEDRGDRLRVRLTLKYRFVILRFKFQVDADAEVGENGRLDLYGISGKPKGLRAHFRLQPVADGKQTLIYCSLRFEVRSLGWLVDYFLRHHPEIELGVFSATAPVIVLTLKEHVENR